MAAAPCIAVVGPTASGKSELALELAERLGGEIVSFDSVQAYRHFDIGTAKTQPPERRGIPHYLLDHVEPTRPYSAGEFARDARSVMRALRERRVLPVLAGGTGFYLEALLNGLFREPDGSPALRERLRLKAASRPKGYMWRVLAKLDRKAAEAIHPNDTQKLVRAVEVILAGNRPLAQQWRDSGEPLRAFRVLTLGLTPPREALRERIERRARDMFAHGLVDEVESLLGHGIPRSAQPFGSLGYAQCLDYLDGKYSLEDAIQSTVDQTRRYAKRQLTWFRNRAPATLWLEAFGDTGDAADWAEREFRAWQS